MTDLLQSLKALCEWGKPSTPRLSRIRAAYINLLEASDEQP